jgi:dihydrofolate synthase/folylpolyglutamate synthase
VCGFVEGKNPQPFFSAFPASTRFYIGNIDIPRNRAVGQTLALLGSHNFEVETHSSLALAYNSAKAAAQESDTIFIGGSTFVVGELFRDLTLLPSE